MDCCSLPIYSSAILHGVENTNGVTWRGRSYPFYRQGPCLTIDCNNDVWKPRQGQRLHLTGEGANPLFGIWPKRVCTAEQGMVFKVLSLKHGIQFHYLASWTECLFGPKPLKECKGCWWACYICGNNDFFLATNLIPSGGRLHCTDLCLPAVSTTEEVNSNHMNQKQWLHHITVWYMATITYPGSTGSSSRSAEYAFGSLSWGNTHIGLSYPV